MENRILPWDSAVSFSKKRFINAADLLIGEDAKIAMRAVGYADSESDSDYERLIKFINTSRLSRGHRSVRAADAILDAVCGISMTDTPERIWEQCGLALEEHHLDRIGLAELLGFSDVFVRISPKDTIPNLCDSRLKFHTILDLWEIIDTATVCDTLDEYFKYINSRLSEPTHSKIGSIRVKLNKYSFNRNSKKRELDGIFYKITRGGRIERDERDQVMTSLMIGLSSIIKMHEIRLTIETDSITALSELYNYLGGMNGMIPKSIIITEHCTALSDFVARFAFSADRKAGIAVALNDPSQTADTIPLGCTLVRTTGVTDVQGLAALPAANDHRISDGVARKLFL